MPTVRKKSKKMHKKQNRIWDYYWKISFNYYKGENMSVKSLSDNQLDKYKQILCQEKEESQNMINKIHEIQSNGMRDNSGDTSSYQLHQADMGSDTDESERRVYYLEKEIDKLKKLNQALHRIYDKSYGICEICGNYIPEKRLEVIPYARFCINCKRKEETRKRK